MSVRTPMLLPKDTELLLGPNRKLRKRNLATPGMDGFWKKSSVKGISEESAAHIAHARRTGTNTHFESTWRKWSSCCSQRLINSFKASLAKIMNFLTYCVHKGYKYSTIADYRSAISEYHDPIDRFTIEEKP